jgi:hypothetical protein
VDQDEDLLPGGRGEGPARRSRVDPVKDLSFPLIPLLSLHQFVRVGHGIVHGNY